ncbi:endonuclease domain-containing protein [Sphingomonas sp. dw_22]|uniref:endonuclease domain-containing protein n=1 Tax=Sphingomonas sp. dw_22 TaxID=2721175 RepID=UPI0031FEF65A
MVTERDLLERAKEMRRNPTELEVRVWRHLSNSQLGYKFRRQAVIFPYICDFFCPAKGLVVEIDGDTHDLPNDAHRDAQLARRGFATVRFTNHEVWDNLDGVMASIVDAVRNRPDRWSGMPHPNPVAGKRCPASFRSCRGHDRPATPEGEGLLP